MVVVYFFCFLSDYIKKEKESFFDRKQTENAMRPE